MKLLHILREKPDENTRELITMTSKDADTETIRLYDVPIDYEEVVNLIFSHDKVFTW